MDSTQVVQQVVEEALSNGNVGNNGYDGFNNLLANEQVASWIGSQLVGFLSGGNGQHLIADLQNVVNYVDGALARYGELTERNAELAAALGACTCWGEYEDCETCRGDGSSGWMTPDQESFSELVIPALLTVNRAKNARIGHKR